MKRNKKQDMEEICIPAEVIYRTDITLEDKFLLGLVTTSFEYGEPISVEKLSCILGKTPTSVERAFRKIQGKGLLVGYVLKSFILELEEDEED